MCLWWTTTSRACLLVRSWISNYISKNSSQPHNTRVDFLRITLSPTETTCQSNNWWFLLNCLFFKLKNLKEKKHEKNSTQNWQMSQWPTAHNSAINYLWNVFIRLRRERSRSPEGMPRNPNRYFIEMPWTSRVLRHRSQDNVMTFILSGHNSLKSINSSKPFARSHRMADGKDDNGWNGFSKRVDDQGPSLDCDDDDTIIAPARKINRAKCAFHDEHCDGPKRHKASKQIAS